MELGSFRSSGSSQSALYQWELAGVLWLLHSLVCPILFRDISYSLGVEARDPRVTPSNLILLSEKVVISPFPTNLVSSGSGMFPRGSYVEGLVPSGDTVVR